jgi:hypothetical protein
MENTLKSATKAHKASIEAREVLQAKASELETAIDEAAESREKLRAVEKARKAEIGSARLDGRKPDVAELDKRAKSLRASVETLESDEAAFEVLQGRIAAAKEAEGKAKSAFDEAACLELCARGRAAMDDYDQALLSLRAALCRLQAIQYAAPKFGGSFSPLWHSRSREISLPFSDGRPFHAPSDHEVDPIAAAIVAEIQGA